jgi:D-glycero-alpha-D-manno-heptose 1-phosphate guanylyltransferase
VEVPPAADGSLIGGFVAQRFEEITAAILAGGLGSRLRSRLADRPKVLAPVHGRPFLAYLLEQLADAGLRHVVLLTGHLAEQVEATFGEEYAGLSLTYCREPSLAGTAGALRNALPGLLSSTVLVLNGDSYCAATFGGFWQFHRCRFADFSLVLTAVNDCSRYGRVSLGPDGRVVRFEEKAKANGCGWVNAGIYLLSRHLIEEIPDEAPLSLEGDMCPQWTADKRCFGWLCTGRFLDIGTPQSYAQAESFFPPPRRNIPA